MILEAGFPIRLCTFWLKAIHHPPDEYLRKVFRLESLKNDNGGIFQNNGIIYPEVITSTETRVEEKILLAHGSGGKPAQEGQ